MGQVLHRGLLQGREPVGVEACVHNKLAEVRRFAEVRGFVESDRGGFGEEVLS